MLQLSRWTGTAVKTKRTATFWCENLRSPFTTRTIRASIYERWHTLQAARQRWSTGNRKTSAIRTRNDRMHHPTISSPQLPRSTMNRRCERFRTVSLRQRPRARTSTTTTGWLTSHCAALTRTAASLDLCERTSENSPLVQAPSPRFWPNSLTLRQIWQPSSGKNATSEAKTAPATQVNCN